AGHVGRRHQRFTARVLKYSGGGRLWRALLSSSQIGKLLVIQSLAAAPASPFGCSAGLGMHPTWNIEPAAIVAHNSPPLPRRRGLAMNGSSITARRGVLLGFILFYAALFTAFGFSSPFLPAFLAERGLKPEQLGVVLGAATVVRLVCGPLAGRLADRFHFVRAQLAVCAVLGADAALLYLAAQGFWTIIAVSLLQAAALAPLVPLADALSLAHARPRPNKQAFEYGWVRGVGSAAF